jgi:hypothetical protein
MVFLGARCEARIVLKDAEAMAWIFEAVAHESPLSAGAEVDVLFDAASLQWLPA